MCKPTATTFPALLYFGDVEFSNMAKGVDLTDTSNPVGVGPQIGDDAGETSVRLQGALNLGGGK